MQEKEQVALVEGSVAAGFPSSADDYLEKALDLNDFLVSNRAATFFIRVAGESMKGAHIESGDLLIVDRSVKARSGHIVVALLNGAFTVKRLKYEKGRVLLRPENPLFKPIEVTKESDFQVWGVVTYVIHRTC